MIVYKDVNSINDKMGDNIINKKRDKAVDKIVSALNNSNGMTITDIVNKTKLSRSAIRTALAKLDGADKVSIKKIGMAKIYLLKVNKK